MLLPRSLQCTGKTENSVDRKIGYNAFCYQVAHYETIARVSAFAANACITFRFQKQLVTQLRSTSSTSFDNLGVGELWRKDISYLLFYITATFAGWSCPRTQQRGWCWWH